VSSSPGVEVLREQRPDVAAITGALDRRDFDLTWNAPIDGGGLLVGNRVDLVLEISAIRS
jgi:hypothetical protein